MCQLISVRNFKNLLPIIASSAGWFIDMGLVVNCSELARIQNSGLFEVTSTKLLSMAGFELRTICTI